MSPAKTGCFSYIVRKSISPLSKAGDILSLHKDLGQRVPQNNDNGAFIVGQKTKGFPENVCGGQDVSKHKKLQYNLCWSGPNENLLQVHPPELV